MQQQKAAYAQYIQQIQNDVVQACVASPARMYLAELVAKLTARTAVDRGSQALANSS